MEEDEHRRQRPFGHGRKRRLAADLERAARRRINGAVGSERAPAHYQALLPMLGCRSRDIRGWRQETGSQLSPWREDGRKARGLQTWREHSAWRTRTAVEPSAVIRWPVAHWGSQFIELPDHAELKSCVSWTIQ